MYTYGFAQTLRTALSGPPILPAPRHFVSMVMPRGRRIAAGDPQRDPSAAKGIKNPGSRDSGTPLGLGGKSPLNAWVEPLSFPISYLAEWAWDVPARAHPEFLETFPREQA